VKTLYAWTMGLCLMLHGAAGVNLRASEATVDPNAADPTKTIRQLLQEEQIRTLTADVNRLTNDLPVLDVLIEELEALSAAPAAAPAEAPTETPAAVEADVAIETLVPEPEIPVQAEEQPVFVNAPDESEPAAEPNNAVAAATVEEAKPQPAEAAAPAPDALLEKFEAVVSVEEPMEVADALYRSGRTQAAQRFYRQVTDREKQPESPDYQWALYQEAVCLQSSDPARARQMFEQLIKSCPASLWAAAAKARLETLTWEEELKTKSPEWMSRDPNSL
jgi:tetratricopeptide (TPR) repeat protein